ncbi:diguanylate cyclase response regulator [Roseobacter sp. AzwK-3b]|uniref:diguanylate cyclase n=1 Tax=Roseobacter sp. AzwK-3b TaxID=351016 RepID=UPI00015694A5|nr:diguanylate cyclase [Roseobacter sp. AzwK-3b]EDM71669.1 diguanylate cyclase response regulator [Roseobacter sp. AzwK-3b]
MSGKILILDDLATNRIVLKVKLSAAYYDVIQARTGAEALALAARENPDLVICAPSLSDMSSHGFVQSLKARDGVEAAPVIMFLHHDDHQARLAALQSGADEILVKPVDESMLLARLRSLLRQHQMARDLRVHAGTASALGFAETAPIFDRICHIGLVAHGQKEAVALAAKLGQLSCYKVKPLDPESALVNPRDGTVPDLYLLRVCAGSRDESVDLIARLNASPHSRKRPIIALLSPDAAGLTPGLLDMGADDVIDETCDTRELQLRLDRQLTRARKAEAMREQLQTGLEAAVIDPLTGLYNRRYALPFLDRLIDETRRDGRGFAVMVADLDHFKRINDRHGHAAGDAVLSQIARLLKSNLRDEDMIARIGGEEFLIVMPDTGRDEASRMARRLCAAVRRSPLHVMSSEAPLNVTISIGATLGHPRPDAETPRVDTLLDEADRALYGSKSDGRNMVTFSRRPAA